MNKDLDIAVYTAITNDYDPPRNDILLFKEYDKFHSAARNFMIYKMLPHKFLYCDISIWVDGNIFLETAPETLVEEWLGGADMALIQHPWRDCVYKEGEASIGRIRKRDPQECSVIHAQLTRYRWHDIPEHLGNLGETGVLIRRHTKEMEAFNEAWWAEICWGSYREQICLPVVLRDFPNLKVNFIKGDIRKHPYFTYKKHKEGK